MEEVRISRTPVYKRIDAAVRQGKLPKASDLTELENLNKGKLPEPLASRVLANENEVNLRVAREELTIKREKRFKEIIAKGLDSEDPHLVGQQIFHKGAIACGLMNRSILETRFLRKILHKVSKGQDESAFITREHAHLVANEATQLILGLKIEGIDQEEKIRNLLMKAMETALDLQDHMVHRMTSREIKNLVCKSREFAYMDEQIYDTRSFFFGDEEDDRPHGVSKLLPHDWESIYEFRDEFLLKHEVQTPYNAVTTAPGDTQIQDIESHKPEFKDMRLISVSTDILDALNEKTYKMSLTDLHKHKTAQEVIQEEREIRALEEAARERNLIEDEVRLFVEKVQKEVHDTDTQKHLLDLREKITAEIPPALNVWAVRKEKYLYKAPDRDAKSALWRWMTRDKSADATRELTLVDYDNSGKGPLPPRKYITPPPYRWSDMIPLEEMDPSKTFSEQRMERLLSERKRIDGNLHNVQYYHPEVILNEAKVQRVQQLQNNLPQEKYQRQEAMLKLYARLGREKAYDDLDALNFEMANADFVFQELRISLEEIQRNIDEIKRQDSTWTPVTSTESDTEMTDVGPMGPDILATPSTTDAVQGSRYTNQYQGNVLDDETDDEIPLSVSKALAELKIEYLHQKIPVDDDGGYTTDVSQNTEVYTAKPGQKIPKEPWDELEKSKPRRERKPKKKWVRPYKPTKATTTMHGITQFPNMSSFNLDNGLEEDDAPTYNNNAMAPLLAMFQMLMQSQQPPQKQRKKRRHMSEDDSD